jgi:hypothetical protein
MPHAFFLGSRVFGARQCIKKLPLIFGHPGIRAPDCFKHWITRAELLLVKGAAVWLSNTNSFFTVEAEAASQSIEFNQELNFARSGASRIRLISTATVICRSA